MRMLFIALFALVFSPFVFGGPTPSWSVIRIESGRIVTTEVVSGADVLIFYNYPQSGLPATQEAKNRISVTVNDKAIPQIEVQYSKDGVFFVRVTPALLGLAASELPDGSYKASASVTETINGVPQQFSAFEPNAFIVLKKRNAVPEAHPLAIAFFLLLAILAMRSKPGK